MIYIDQNLRIPGIRPDAPNLDAAAYLGDRIGEAERRNRITAETQERARPAREAMKLANLSEREACAFIQGLQHVIANCGWSHTQAAIDAQEALTNAHFYLEEQAEQRA